MLSQVQLSIWLMLRTSKNYGIIDALQKVVNGLIQA